MYEGGTSGNILRVYKTTRSRRAFKKALFLDNAFKTITNEESNKDLKKQQRRELELL